jgi:3-isopropylmalate/(R)-2-methylmalate dehydratase small subunit
VSGERVEAHSGQAIVVRGDDIDTDRIIPARYLAAVSFAGLEDGVFADARFTPDRQPKDHPFNEERFQNASILVVNRNFGCGSSREHAPQALMRWGIRALLGESFAEIFFGNCTALGIPAVTAARDDVAALMDAIELDPAGEVSIDLEAMTASSRAGTIAISLPEGARQQLLDGTWNALQTLRSAEPEIRATAARIPYVSGF